MFLLFFIVVVFETFYLFNDDTNNLYFQLIHVKHASMSSKIVNILKNDCDKKIIFFEKFHFLMS